MWTWSGVVLPIFTIASVMAAVSCRFWSWVRPAYHWIVMLGMLVASSSEPLHVVGEVRRERIGLDRAVRVEADGEVLAGPAAGAILGVEPGPRLVAAVDPDLVGLAEHPPGARLVCRVDGDLGGLGRREHASGVERTGRGGEDRQREEHAVSSHRHLPLMRARRRRRRRGARSPRSRGRARRAPRRCARRAAGPGRGSWRGSPGGGRGKGATFPSPSPAASFSAPAPRALPLGLSTTPPTP